MVFSLMFTIVIIERLMYQIHLLKMKCLPFYVVTGSLCSNKYVYVFWWSMTKQEIIVLISDFVLLENCSSARHFLQCWVYCNQVSFRCHCYVRWNKNKYSSKGATISCIHTTFTHSSQSVNEANTSWTF